MQAYVTLQKQEEAEWIERKSRFVAAVAPVCSEEEALAFLATRRMLHRDASHHTFAYLLRAGAQRCSDDGEPQGTAGVPLLHCLLKEELSDVAVVVSRYFGGILLGAGGLVRAYSHAASLAVNAAKRRILRPCVRCALEIDYAFYGKLSYLLPQYDCLVEGSDFGAMVKLILLFPKEAYLPFVQALTEETAGGFVPEILGECFAEIPQKNV